MSDMNGAAQAAAEQPSLPMEPVQPPNPIESTGPQPEPKQEPKAEPKAEPKDKPSSSISEALKKAEAKVKADAEKAPVKDAKAEKAANKAEAKPEPKEVKSDGPTRGEDGKFTSKEPKQETNAEPKATDAWRETPKRFSEDGKRDWEKAPDSVKAETHRAIRELENGINEYKQKYEPIKQYDELARQNNTTVKDALDRYTMLERELTSQNPQEKFTALQKVFDYAGVNMREFVARMAGTNPDQNAVQVEHQLQQFRNRISELEHELSGYRTAKEQDLMKTVDEFAARQPRFEELAPKIAKLLESGFAENLDEAYAMADRLIPAAAKSAIPVTPETPAAHTPAKSVAGSPSLGSSPTTRKPSNSIKEALQRAMAQAS